MHFAVFFVPVMLFTEVVLHQIQREVLTEVFKRVEAVYPSLFKGFVSFFYSSGTGQALYEFHLRSYERPGEPLCYLPEAFSSVQVKINSAAQTHIHPNTHYGFS